MNKSVPYRSLELLRALLVLVFLGVAVWYLTWRLGTFNPQAKVFSWLLYAAELYALLTTLLHLFMTWCLTERSAPPPAVGLSVDVFIPTINEPVDMLRHTLLAAVHMDYAHETWLLDDGNRAEMAALARDLGCRYLARTENKDAKAGNFNNALKQSRADFIAVFDADHAPQKNFLTHVLGYFQDAQVAFVQTPQDFFNLDSYQHRGALKNRVVWTEQSLFFRVIQRGKDFWNAAFFCGSCAVLRRSALDNIGGFATGTVTEDLHTSIKLHKQGFKSVYHAESLAFGVAPSSVVPFLKQRIRWGQGAMQVWRKEGILFCRGLTLAQRLNYFASVLAYFDGWQKGLFYMAPAIVLLSGVMPISALGSEFLWHFIPYYLLNFWVFEEVGRGYGRTAYIEQYNMSRFAGFAWATLGVFNESLKFSVTPKGATSKQDTYRFIAPQFAVLLLNGVAIPLGIVFYFGRGHLPAEGMVVNIIWAAVNLLLAWLVVAFALHRSSFRRAEYRFPIPLPARVKIGGHLNGFVTVDNLSSSGCRMYGSFPTMLEQGARVEGALVFPSGALPFKGEIASRVEGQSPVGPYIKGFGCHFEWDDPKQHDALDLFLYGSDLQWQLLHLSDQGKTPLDWLRGLAGKGKAEDFGPKHWAAMVYRPSDASDAELSRGLVSVSQAQDGPHAIIVFKPLPAASSLLVGALTRRGQIVLEGTPASEKRLESPVAPVYMYQIENCSRRKEWPLSSSHQAEQQLPFQGGALPPTPAS